MNCGSLEHSIALYVEGDLREAERAKIDSHLQGCSTCRELADALLASQAIFKDLRRQMPHPSEISEVRQRVLNEVGDLQPAPAWVLAINRLVFAGLRRKTAIAGVALGVLVTGGLWFYHSPAPVDRHLAQTAQVAQIESPSPEILSAILPAAGAMPRVAKHVQARRELVDVKLAISAELPPDAPVAQVTQVSQLPMKFLTDDPNIIIYWLPTDKGD
jgi:anti-sigma factor RsiW